MRVRALLHYCILQEVYCLLAEKEEEKQEAVHKAEEEKQEAYCLLAEKENENAKLQLKMAGSVHIR